MATPTPTYTGATAYDLTVGIPVNMDELLYLLDPDDVPLTMGIGPDAMQLIGRAPVDEIQFSWLDDNYLLPSSTLAANVVTAATEIVVASGTQGRFSTGDGIRVINARGGNELMRVTGYSATTADTLLVTKGYSGTSTTYATSEKVTVVGSMLEEGTDPENARTVDRTENTNVTQIFGPTKVDMSRTEQQVRKYGVSNEFNHQLMKRIREQQIQVEQSLLYGIKTNSSGNKIRTTGGLDNYLSTEVDATSTQATVAKIEANQKNCYDNGGIPNLFVANPKSLSDLNSISDTSRVRMEFADSRRGRVPVRIVTTEFGDIQVVRHRWCDPSHAYGITREQVIMRVLQPMIFERLAKTGDSDKGQVVCELGWEIKGEEHMFRMTALSYS